MQPNYDVKRICEAQSAIFPDGGRAAVRRVRHRSFLRKLCDRVCRERFALTIVLVVSFAASLLLFALFSQPFPGLRLVTTGLSAIRSGAIDRESLRREAERLSPEDRAAIDELLVR